MHRQFDFWILLIRSNSETLIGGDLATVGPAGAQNALGQAQIGPTMRTFQSPE